MTDLLGITLVGLGPGAFGQLSLAAWDTLQKAAHLYLRTAIHPTVPELEHRGIKYTSFDSYYDQADTFDAVYQAIANELLQAAQNSHVVYAVPGHPLVGETSVQLVLQGAKQMGINIDVVPSMSALDAIFAAARFDPGQGLQIIDALNFTVQDYLPHRPALFLQVYNRMATSDLKLQLLDVLDPELPVLFIKAAGVPGEEKLLSLPLHEIDMRPEIDHLTSLYVPAALAVESTSQPNSQSKPVEHPLDPLVDVLKQLRGENGCPWDRKQTHASLKRYLIEEAYEVVDAVDEADWNAVCEELGDVLLQVVFHAQLGTEAGTFNIDDVVDAITAKMIRRHPHVFGDVEANDVAAVLRNWDAIKQVEKAEQGKPEPKSILQGIPRHLPALMLAEELQKKAAKVGFEWADVTGAIEKVIEEYHELQEAIDSNDNAACNAELGDLLFAIVNVARYLKVDPELALRGTADKFMRRFHYIEEQAQALGRNLADMTVEEMDQIWNQAKELEAKR